MFTAGRMMQCDTPQCTAVPPGGDSLDQETRTELRGIVNLRYRASQRRRREMRLVLGWHLTFPSIRDAKFHETNIDAIGEPVVSCDAMRHWWCMHDVGT